jgi:16S rRNA (uracil1498-N3)-methyltransferase
LREEDPTRRPGSALEAVLLDPGSELGLESWIRGRIEDRAARWTSDRPLLVLVGPEGGFTDAERERFLAHGATAVRLGPHVLRVETAAEAAMAVLAAACVSAVRS